MADRASIRTMARIRADQDASTFPTDAQYNLIIDACSKEVQYDLVAGGYQYNETFQSIDVGALGFDEIYQINSGNPIISMMGVFRVEGDQRIELQRLDRSQEAAMRSNTSNQCTHYLVYMDLGTSIGQGISFYPSPVGGRYELYYVREWPGFATDATVWRGPARSDELISILAAAKGCKKEGEIDDARALMEEYQELRQKVLEMASRMDGRNASVIRDVYGSTASSEPFNYPIDRGY